MKAIACFLLLSAFISAQPVTYFIAGNLIRFRGPQGIADFEWLNSSAFRFKRDWRPAGDLQLPRTANKISFQVREVGTRVILTSHDLVVDLDRATFRVLVTPPDGHTAIDMGAPRRAPGKIILERGFVPGERIYGLPTMSALTLNVRGLRIAGQRADVISSAGFGVSFRTPAVYVYDVGSSDSARFRIVLQGSDSLEQFFYYGPTIKDILDLKRRQRVEEELPSGYLRVLHQSEVPPDATVVEPSRDACAFARELTLGAMAGILYPAADLQKTPVPLAPLMPLLYSSSGSIPEAAVQKRKLWIPYLTAYLREAYDRGFPLIRPLAMQFPRDAELAEVADVFMIGDEILIAPQCSDSRTRTVRLPMGIWTDLRDNREYAGRRIAELNATAQSWPLLAKNGTIVPLNAGDRVELHYYPKLGAEFFLYEPAVRQHSQFHASPAGDYWRLEIETKVRRRYEWVVHHVDPPRHVARAEFTLDAVSARSNLRPGTWFHDAKQRNLHIVLDSLAGADDVINIRF